MSKQWVHLLVVLVFSLIGIKAFFQPGLYTAHDIWHQVVRFYYYYQAFNDGQFPPAWVGQLANNFGYPLYLFSYHLPWILGVILSKMGFNIFDTIKGLFIISYIGSGLTMYLFVYSLLKDKSSALLSSILYLWLPYHFLIIFVGASMGTAFVFTFLPFMFLGINLCGEKSKWGIPTVAVSLSGIILSQVMNMAFLAPLTLIFMLWKFNNTHSKPLFLKNIIIGLVLGLLISAFYLLPAAFYQHETRFHTEKGIGTIYERNFINFKQLIYSKWGFSPIVNNAKNEEISFQLGFAQWISFLLILLLLISNKVPKVQKTLTIYLLLSFVASIYFTQDISKPIWKLAVNYAAIDFPFRFILPAAFSASILAGVLIVSLRKKAKFFMIVFLIFVAIYTNRNHINVNQYTDFPVSSYLDLETEITTNTYHEYLPISADSKLLDVPWNEVLGEDLTVSNLEKNTNLLSFDVTSTKQQSVSVGQFYFPGQTLYINNQISQFEVDKEGRIKINLPEGKNSIAVKYQDTYLIKIAKTLSLIGLLIIISIILWHKKQDYYHKK